MVGDPFENNYIQLRQRAVNNRDQYWLDRERDLNTDFQAHPEKYNNVFIGGYTGALNQLHRNRADESAQANFQPQWDAALEGLYEAGGMRRKR